MFATIISILCVKNVDSLIAPMKSSTFHHSNAWNCNYSTIELENVANSNKNENKRMVSCRDRFHITKSLWWVYWTLACILVVNVKCLHAPRVWTKCILHFFLSSSHLCSLHCGRRRSSAESAMHKNFTSKYKKIIWRQRQQRNERKQTERKDNSICSLYYFSNKA